MTIATLVPAFKPQYFAELAFMIEHQILKPSLVIVSDDTPTGEFLKLWEDPAVRGFFEGIEVEVVPGPRRGARANMLHAIERWGGRTELVHVLMDDDLIFPSFYRDHANAITGNDLTASVSARWICTEQGLPLMEATVPQQVAQAEAAVLMLEPAGLVRSVVGWRDNWLGEMSNTVFTRAGIAHYVDGLYEGVSFRGLEDVASLLMNALHGRLGYLPAKHGGFRMGAGQITQSQGSHQFKMGIAAWAALAIASYRAGHLPPEEAGIVVQTVVQTIDQLYPGDPAFTELREAMLLCLTDTSAIAEFDAVWDSFIEQEHAAR